MLDRTDTSTRENSFEPESSISELVDRARAGDGGALNQLAVKFYALNYATAFRILKNQHDAEDAVQDAWMNVSKSISGFKGGSKFSTWLHRIVINCALQMIGPQKRKRIGGSKKEEQYIAHVSLTRAESMPDELLINEQTRAAIETILSQMGDTHVDAWRLVSLHGNVKKAAVAAGVNEATLKSRYYRAVRKLIEKIEVNSGAPNLE